LGGSALGWPGAGSLGADTFGVGGWGGCALGASGLGAGGGVGDSIGASGLGASGGAIMGISADCKSGISLAISSASLAWASTHDVPHGIAVRWISKANPPPISSGNVV